MAWRPDPTQFDKPLTKEDLADWRRALSMLSEHSVRDAYRLAWERCKMQGDGLPPPSAVQELVTAWKLPWAGDGADRQTGANPEETRPTA
jgi:hypothetical protein